MYSSAFLGERERACFGIGTGAEGCEFSRKNLSCAVDRDVGGVLQPFQ